MKPAKSKFVWLVACALGICLAAFTVAGGSHAASSAATRASDNPPSGEPDPTKDTVETEDSEEEESIPVPPDLQDSQASPTEPAPQAPANPEPQPSVPQVPAEPASTPAAPAAPAGVGTPTSTGQAAGHATPAVPPGSGHPDIYVRYFDPKWEGPLTLHYWISHVGRCEVSWGGTPVPIPTDRTPSDNSHPFPDESHAAPTVSNFPPQGGKITLTCWGIPPDESRWSKEYSIGPAPVSTTKVTVQTKRKGLRTKGKKAKPVQVVVPVAPPEVAGSYQGWCGVRPDGTWGFSQASLPGGAPALYKPGVGLHCDVGRVSKAQWKAYVCKYFRCVDPMKTKK